MERDYIPFAEVAGAIQSVSLRLLGDYLAGGLASYELPSYSIGTIACAIFVSI
jgi:hypothetical protein